ncbi:MAG: type II secretion system F family protein [Pirellulales bacterium]
MTGRLIVFWSLVIWAGIACVALFGGPGFFFWSAMLVVIAMTYSRHRQTRRDAFVQLLALAAERQMPLAPLAAAFGKETHNRRYTALAARLEAGEPLWSALGQSGNLASPAVAVAALAGERTGAVGPALRDAVRARGSQVSFWSVAGEQTLYLCMILLVALTLIGFFSLQIVPAVLRIFEDFDSELPALTQQLIRFTSFLERSGLAIAFLVLLVVAILVLLGYYIGWIRFRIPIVGRLTDRLDAAGILRALALPAERQQSFEAVLVALETRHPNHAVRRKLQLAISQIGAGGDWIDSLLARRMIRAAEGAVLRSAQRVGNLPWALREMADRIERLLAYRLRALSHLVFPLAVLAIGMVVMMFVVGYFLPLVQLITSMAV